MQPVPGSSLPVPTTPLAPSVEKAYYRKCIELKRRLNQVESANDEMRLKRLRLDRSIMKMRLERAFLLEQINRRMDADVDRSEGSEDDALATPPPDRPHRDKRRRHGQNTTPGHHASSQPGHDGVDDPEKSRDQQDEDSRARGDSQYDAGEREDEENERRMNDGSGDA